MRRPRRLLPITLGLLVALLCLLFVPWGPDTRSQDAIPVCDTTSAATPTSTEFPSTLVVEKVLADTPILDASMNPTTTRSRVSYSCIEAGTTSFKLQQDYAATIVVVEGALDIQFTKACVSNDDGDCLIVGAPPGVAYVYRADDLTTQQVLTVSPTDWLTLEAGDILVIANVDINLRTTDTIARFISSGAAIEVIGGGCPCVRAPP